MKYVLALMALALAGLLAWQWYDWPPQWNGRVPGDQLPGAESPAEAEPRSPLELLDPPLVKEEYASVSERPLFLPDRRPPAEEPDEPPAEEEQPETAIDTMDLTAIIITPQESMAWVQSPTKQTPQKLRLGDELDGWTLKAIKSDEVELERQGETDTLVLRDYSKSPPPAARPPRRAIRPRNAARRRAPNPPAGAERPELREPGDDSNDQPRPGARQPRVRNNAQGPR